MKYEVRDIFEYIIALVNEFGRKFGLSDKQAYNYIRHHKGISFIEKNYGIIHTLDFNEAVDTLYNSETYSKLTDPRSGLYFQSSQYVYSFLKNELSTGKLA